MMPSNSEVIAVDDLASLNDLVYVFTSNDTNSVLCWSTDKKIIDAVFVTSDLSNFLISFNDEIVQNFINQSPLSIQEQMQLNSKGPNPDDSGNSSMLMENMSGGGGDDNSRT